MIAWFFAAWAQDPPPPIVGGSTTSSFEQVGALAALDNNGYGAAFCSGTLIDDTWVLTAAHCIEGSEAAEGFRSDGYTIYFVTATNVWNASYDEWHEVSDMIAHPYYSGSETNIQNDIGLLELRYSLNSITPAILNTSTPSTNWGDITYVGFGLTGDNNENSMGVRRTVDVPIWNYLPYDQQTLYTYDPSGQTNICSGDSGGAAFRYTSGNYLLAGVNSFGFDINGGYPHCEGAGAAAGSTRVDAYLNWIQQYVDFQSSGGSSGGGSGGSEPSSEPSSEPTSEPSISEGEFELPIGSDFYGDEAPPQKAGCQMIASTKIDSLSWGLFFSFLLVGWRSRQY